MLNLFRLKHSIFKIDVWLIKNIIAASLEDKDNQSILSDLAGCFSNLFVSKHIRAAATLKCTPITFKNSSMLPYIHQTRASVGLICLTLPVIITNRSPTFLSPVWFTEASQFPYLTRRSTICVFSINFLSPWEPKNKWGSILIFMVNAKQSNQPGLCPEFIYNVNE